MSQQDRSGDTALSPSGDVGQFRNKFRRSWQRLTEASRNVSLISSSNSNNGHATTVEEEAERDDSIDDLLNEVDQNGSSILLRRSDQISLSYVSISQPDDIISDKILSEMEFISTHNRVVIKSISNEGGLFSHHTNTCASLEGSVQSVTFLKVDDVVEFACGVDCRTGRLSAHNPGYVDPSAGDDSIDDSNLYGESGSVINMHDRINAIQSDLKSSDTTICVTTTKTMKERIRSCQASVLFSKKEVLDELAASQLKNLKNGGNNISSCLDVGLRFSQDGDGRLTIGAISKREGSWFRSCGCAVREGDIVVGINEFIASRMAPQDASSLIQDILSSSQTSHLSISTIVPSRQTQLTRWRSVRKAAVAASGGTLVASGAILMATPLHPIGHAMALGGVGLLGTEYEAPKKAMKNAKERLKETKQGWSERRRMQKASSLSTSSVDHKQDESN